jgi:nitrite reductase/ring-hydroxylating ferredoxin subunit
MVRARFPECLSAHRGSRLIDGDAHTGLAFCVEARLRCPYHGWTYDQTGALVAMPEPHRVADFDAGLTALHPVHVEQWRGLVFIALESPALPLADALEPFVPAQAGGGNSNLRRLGEPRNFTIQADWKLASEHLLTFHIGRRASDLKPQLFDVAAFTPCGPLAVRASGALGWCRDVLAVRAYAVVTPTRTATRRHLCMAEPTNPRRTSWP